MKGTIDNAYIFVFFQIKKIYIQYNRNINIASTNSKDTNVFYMSVCSLILYFQVTDNPDNLLKYFFCKG
jgi:hypothetical protein